MKTRIYAAPAVKGLNVDPKQLSNTQDKFSYLLQYLRLGVVVFVIVWPQ